MFCSLITACLGIEMRTRGLAMTGVLRLSGEVLGVGGIEAKLDYALSVNRTKVVLPKANHDEVISKVEANGAKGWNALELLPVGNIWDLITTVFPCDDSVHGDGTCIVDVVPRLLTSSSLVTKGRRY